MADLTFNILEPSLVGKIAGKAAPNLDVVANGNVDGPLQRIKQWQSIAR